VWDIQKVGNPLKYFLLTFLIAYTLFSIATAQSAVKNGRTYEIVNRQLVVKDQKTKRLLWKFGSRVINVTESSSVVFYHMNVIVFDRSDLYSLNTNSGKVIWKGGLPGDLLSGHIDLDKFFAIFTRNLKSFVFCYDLKTGKVKWKFETGFEKSYVEIVINSTIILSNSDSSGAYIRTVSTFLDSNSGERIKDFGDFISAQGKIAFFVFSSLVLDDSDYPAYNLTWVDFYTWESKTINYNFYPRENCGSTKISGSDDIKVVYNREKTVLYAKDDCGYFQKTYFFNGNENQNPIFAPQNIGR
jgi:outer membrane protein assembly factor BamB